MAEIIDFQGTIQFRRGNAADWTAQNVVLHAGEMGVELDTNKFKIGDGVRPWNLLPYGGLVGPQGPQGPRGLIGQRGEKGETGDVTPELLQAKEEAEAAAESAATSAAAAEQSATGSSNSAATAIQIANNALAAVNVGFPTALPRTSPDYNTLRQGGVYSIGGSPLNGPPVTSDTVLFVSASSNGDCFQIACPTNESLWWRATDDGGASWWQWRAMNSFGFRGYTAVSTSTTLTASLHAGRLLRCSGANVTLTLDLAENFTRGDTITILCTASTGQTINVVTSGSDTVAINHGAPGANVPMPIVLRGGDVLILSCYTTNGWSVVLNTSALLSKYQNLADLTNLATARANLDVYSRQEVITEANKLGEVEGLIATQTTATTTSVYMRKAVLVSPTDGSSRVVTRDRSVAMVNDISVVGAGGRDTSTAIGTGWYHLYAIHNDTTGTMSTIVSVNNPYSTTGPVLPAGYTRWVFLTPVRMTSGSIVLFRTQGRYFSYRGWQSVLDAGTSTTLATPPNLFWLWGDAESWILAGRVVANTTGGAVYAYIRNSDQSTDDTIFANSINGTQFWTDAFFEITVRTSASFAYRVGHTGTAGTQVPALYMWCKGFYF